MKLDYIQLRSDIEKLAENLMPKYSQFNGIYPVPRGGVPIGMVLAQRLNMVIVNKPLPDTLIVDDLIDTGKTLSVYADNPKAVLYRKPHSPLVDFFVKEIDGWIEFPYEETEKDIEDNIVRILEHLGEDPTREGLLNTPKRHIAFLKEFTTKPKFKFTTFEADGYDQMIVQTHIPFFSLCEHHLLPFHGYASVAYLPDKTIVGLSKLARTVEYYSRALQNQERITKQVADKLTKELKPLGVAVLIEARHMCMEMRGVKKHDTTTTTSMITGVFRDDPSAKAEFMELAKCVL